MIMGEKMFALIDTTTKSWKILGVYNSLEEAVGAWKKLEETKGVYVFESVYGG
jgi:hypothetical protein